MSREASKPTSVPEQDIIDAWLSDAPTGVLIKWIGELRREAVLLRSQADALERTLKMVERIKALRASV